MKPITILQAAVLLILAVMGAQAKNQAVPSCPVSDNISAVTCDITDV